MKTILSWSSGKDCAWALHRLRGMPEIELVGLVTTINENADRVAMHGVRRTLLAAQASACGLPLHVIGLPYPCSNEIYEARMRAFITQAQADAVEAVAFGDLFLEDVRAYRERQMADTGLKTLFPLWGSDTRQLAQDMIRAGVKARISCLDPAKVPRGFAGHAFDQALLDALPDHVDPCGEHGEFHTFAYDGPAFQRPLSIVTGETIESDGFVFTDLYSDPQAC